MSDDRKPFTVEELSELFAKRKFDIYIKKTAAAGSEPVLPFESALLIERLLILELLITPIPVPSGKYETEEFGTATYLFCYVSAMTYVDYFSLDEVPALANKEENQSQVVSLADVRNRKQAAAKKQSALGRVSLIDRFNIYGMEPMDQQTIEAEIAKIRSVEENLGLCIYADALLDSLIGSPYAGFQNYT